MTSSPNPRPASAAKARIQRRVAAATLATFVLALGAVTFAGEPLPQTTSSTGTAATPTSAATAATTTSSSDSSGSDDTGSDTSSADTGSDTTSAETGVAPVTTSTS